MCLSVLLTCVSVYWVCMVPTDIHMSKCIVHVVVRSNHVGAGSLEEHFVLLIAEPSLQPLPLKTFF